MADVPSTAGSAKETTTEGNLRTEIYQGQFINKEFDFPLNVVILVKTHLKTSAQAHVILFSTDLESFTARDVRSSSISGMPGNSGVSRIL